MRGENREPRLGETAGWHKMSEQTLRETETLSPDPSLVPAYGSEDDQKARASNTPRELWERMQLGEEDWRQAKRQAEQLVRDATASDAIKDAWMKLIHAEIYLVRGVMAFLPRMQREEANPTFKHPENWDSLSFQEKANLILADKAVKLMELLCRGSVTRHQESENITNQGSNLLDQKHSILGGEANTDVAIPLIQEGGNITRHGLGRPDKKPSILDGEANTDVEIPLI